MFRIYRNLHRGDWTIQHRVKGKGWRKLASDTVLTAPTVEFRVYDSGRERTRRERRKHVHAYALVPYLSDALVIDPTEDDYVVSYNPYDDEGFRTVLDSGRKHRSNLSGGKAAIFAPGGVIYFRSVY